MQAIAVQFIEEREVREKTSCLYVTDHLKFPLHMRSDHNMRVTFS